MQAGRTGRGSGPLNQSLLYQSLKPYLDTPTRQQPIIGLDSVTECVKAGSQEALYLCEVCLSRMKRTDVRNHIMGSLHRYSYIKARHPDLAVGWGQTVDVPKLAWPLMEMASVLEKRDGPGVVEVLQLDAITFKEMGQRSAASAVSQMAAIRREQMEKGSPLRSELTQTHVENGAVQSSPKKRPFKSQNAAVRRPAARVPVQTDRSTSRADTAALKLPLAKSAEPRARPESGTHVLDGHAVIGLDCVVECRRRDHGRPSCFLCQCCRVKSDPDAFIAHLTSPSHISNYLMEVYPECVDAMMAGLTGEEELLRSVAQRVEQIEGRGEHKVLEWPTHLCDQLRDKTYHWCIQMFSDSEQWSRAARKKNSSGLKALDSFPQLTGRKDGPEAAKKRRTGNETHPVFKVSMPMSEGAFVLERASFSLPHAAATSTPSSPPPDPGALGPPAPSSNLELSPLTVTLFERPHSPLADLPSRHIEVRSEDVEENIPVVIGRREQAEGGPAWGLPAQGSRTDVYRASPPPPCSYPQERLQHGPTQASRTGRSHPGSGLTGAGDGTPRARSSGAPPIVHDHHLETSPKPTVTFYYCTPGGQRRC